MVLFTRFFALVWVSPIRLLSRQFCLRFRILSVVFFSSLSPFFIFLCFLRFGRNFRAPFQVIFVLFAFFHPNLEASAFSASIIFCLFCFLGAIFGRLFRSFSGPFCCFFGSFCCLSFASFSSFLIFHWSI